MNIVPTAQTITGYLTTAAGAPINATVVLKVLRPSGSVDTVALSNPTTGRYEATYSPPEPGVYTYSFQVSGAAIGRFEGSFEAHASALP